MNINKRELNTVDIGKTEQWIKYGSQMNQYFHMIPLNVTFGPKLGQILTLNFKNNPPTKTVKSMSGQEYQCKGKHHFIYTKEESTARPI